MPADAKVGEHRIGKNFRELLGARALPALGRKALDVDLEHLGEAQQYAGRHGTLIALQVIEIGSRNAELRRHHALLQAAVAAQPLQSCAEEKLAVPHPAKLSTIYN